MYNLTLFDNANDLLTIVSSANTVSNNIFIPLFFILGTFIITFIAFKTRYETNVSILGSSIICTITSYILWTLSLISTSIFMYPLIILVGTIIVYMLSD